jgi:hypothetical protein
VRFEAVGRNRVRMSGVRSRGAPPTLKVAGFVDKPGFIMDCEISLAGLGARGRAEVMAEALRLRLGMAGWLEADFSVDLVGLGSVLRAGAQPLRGEPPELRVHVSARCADAQSAQAVEDEIYALTLSGPAGGCSVRSEKRPRIEVLDGFIAPSAVSTQLAWEVS